MHGGGDSRVGGVGGNRAVGGNSGGGVSSGGWGVGGSSTSKNRCSHHKYKTPKLFELKQS